MRAVLLALILLSPALAAAHPNDQAFLELLGRRDEVTASLDIAVPLAVELAKLPASQDLTAVGLNGAAPALFAATLGSGELRVEDQACEWGPPQVVADGMRLRIAAAARCPEPPGALRWSLPFVEQMAPTFRILGRADLDGAKSEFTAGPGREAIALDGLPPSGALQLARGLWRWLSPQGLLSLAALLGAALSLRRGQTVLAASAGWLLGLGIGFAGLAFARWPMAFAAAVAGAAPALDTLRRSPDTIRWRIAAPAGVVVGLALAPRIHGWIQLAGGALGLAIAALLAYGLGRLVPRGPRRIRGAAMFAALLAAIGAVLQLF